MNFAAALRRDLAEQAKKYTQAEGLPYCLSYGDAPIVVLPRTTRVPGMGTSCREATGRYKQIRCGEDVWRRFTRKADDPSPVLIADVGWSLMPVQVPMRC